MISPAQAVVINEVMASNGSTIADENGDFEDWIELYNPGDEPLNLAGYGLSDDPSRPQRWTFPPVVIEPGSHLLVWASGKDRSSAGSLHTNFSLSSSGETLVLTDPSGVTLDEFPAAPIPRDASYGRHPDGGVDFGYFGEPTPGSSNSMNVYTGVTPPPRFSHSPGFHAGDFQLGLLHDDGQALIVYTLDGSEPDRDHIGGRPFEYKLNYPRNPGSPFGEILEKNYESHVHDAPISVRDRSAEADALTWMASTWDLSPAGYAPISPVYKGTVVRARAYRDGELPSAVVTGSFFVSTDGARRYDLPVISLAIQENHLFGYTDGIYTPGIDFDEWRRAFPASAIRFSAWANYHRNGREWEQPVHFELFHPDGRIFRQDLGWRVHGGGTRARAQKSIRLYARNSYDSTDVMEFDFFDQFRGRVTDLPITSFKTLLLRNSGDDTIRTRIRDAFLQRLLSPLNVDHQAVTPAVHFINGEFWGLINIRERIDTHFIAAHHGIEPDDVVILVNESGIREGEPSDVADWHALLAYAEEHDLADPAHFAHVEDRVDIDNFLHYQLGQIYIKNTDWPWNNNSFWRTNAPRRERGFPASHDGRWRWILFDLDFGFGRVASWEPTANNAAGLDTLSLAAQSPPLDIEAHAWASTLFRNLLDAPSFREAFILRMGDHINTTFHPTRVDALVDELHGAIAPHLQEHRERWRDMGNPDPTFLKTFGRDRPDFVRQHVVDYFGLAGVYTLLLEVNTPLGGVIDVNTATPTMSPAAETAHWEGVYFLGLPLRLQARPHYGFRFTGWRGDVRQTASSLQLHPVEDTRLEAGFQSLGEPALLHYWSFNAADRPFEPDSGEGSLAITALGEAEATTGSGNGFSAANARQGARAGTHLRLNSPLAASLEFHVPTNGMRDIRVTYESRRSGQGAGFQAVEISTDGTNFNHLADIIVRPIDPVVTTLDLRDVPAVADNPLLAIRITFGFGDGGGAGNHRFDNFVVEGFPMDAPDGADADGWLIR